MLWRCVLSGSGSGSGSVHEDVIQHIYTTVHRYIHVELGTPPYEICLL